MADKVRELEQKLDESRKENDDLKYDNTLLYEKNVEKDEKLLVHQDQIAGLQNKGAKEKERINSMESEIRNLNQQIANL